MAPPPLAETWATGVVYEISDGVETVLTDFSFITSEPAANPQGPVILDPAGDLFGTVQAFYDPNVGGVWEIPVQGSPTELSTAPDFIGEVVVMDKSGNLYGTHQLWRQRDGVQTHEELEGIHSAEFG
jgi:hypothetical protein